VSSADVHVHLLNAPDIEAYTIGAGELQKRLEPLVAGRGRTLAVTEDHDPERVTAATRAATVLIGFALPHRRIRELPRLAWIHLVSAGVDHLLPLDWLPSGVVLTNSSGVHSELAGEYAACALLMLNAGMPRHVTNQRRGRWDQVFNSPIRGKTVVLIGVGAIGGTAAMHAKRLGLRVIGVRRSRRRHPHVDEMVGPGDLPAVLPRADFLLLTAPLTPETRGLIGARELDALPRGAGVVNIARAGLVDYAALRAKLERGELRGAILDVCDPEPLPPESPLWRVPDLLITPHISSDPTDYVERMLTIITDNLDRLLTGRPLRNRVQRARGY
jgi:phosphoglycerate dehydrogenase-like enzyme